ncbi:MAG TPA: diaminopimelate epimerase [Nakamurella sp.]
MTIPPPNPARAVAFVKGHGTENDFVLLPDPDGTLEVSPSQVRAVCDRHAGLGADGIIRVARAPAGSVAPFVMDYRNADGSLAEICGNGARLFARYLVDAGWAAPGLLLFQTRGGIRRADVPPTGDVTISMGPARLGVKSVTGVGDREIDGIAVDVGNPHLVCLTGVDISTLDLTVPPRFDPEVFGAGVNIEFFTVIGADRVKMRVHERGVGETRSCGTGTVAVAAAYLASTGRQQGTVTVGVPGGSVEVTIARDDSTLTGPAVLVASGVIDGGFWERHR